MAMAEYWVAGATTSAVRLGMRLTAAGVITALADGSTYTGDTVSSGDVTSKDGIGFVTVSCSSSVSVALKIDGSTVATLTVAPLSETMTIVATACDRMGWMHPGAEMLTRYPSMGLYLGLGDNIYADKNFINTNNTFVSNGYTLDVAGHTYTLANYFNWWRALWANPGFGTSLRAIPKIMVQDDHETYNDHDGTAANIITQTASDGFTLDSTQAANLITYAQAAYKYRCSDGNWPTPQTPNYGGIPLGEHYMWVCDCFTSERSALTATDNASKYLLGATQIAAMQAAIMARPARSIVLLAISKELYTTNDTRTDGYYAYQTEAVALKAWLQACGRTIVILTGDWHQHYVYHTSNITQICCSPLGDLDNGTATTQTDAAIMWRPTGYAGGNCTAGMTGYAAVTLQSGTVRLDVVERGRGRVFRAWRDAGSSALRYSRPGITAVVS